MTKKVKVSQSLMKEMIDYNNKKQCGLVVEAKYVKGMSDEPSEVQKLGQWFEFMATGALNREGKVPQPEKTQKGEYTASYKKMLKHIERFSKIMKHYGIKIIERGLVVETEIASGIWDIHGLAEKDIVIEYESGLKKIIPKGTPLIVDIKTTGLIEDKWNDMGWHLDSLSNKTRLMLQPIHYKWLAKEKFGKEYEFIFMLFSNTNDTDEKIIHVDIDPDTIANHHTFVEGTYDLVMNEINKGWTPHPEYSRCETCFLREECKHKVLLPKIHTVSYP